MPGRMVAGFPRVPAELLAGLAEAGVATVHESMGRAGLMDPAIRPVWPAPAVAGSALTVSVPPGDNWMIHVAMEALQPGDLLVVAPTSPCLDGYFGELLAVSARVHGCAGLVIDAGVRDVAELRRMGFPVWSRAVSAQGTVKATLGDVGLPLVCGGRPVSPGDAVVADEDGVCVVPHALAAHTLAAARTRLAREAAMRARLAAGELGLDIHGMRERLAAAGLRRD